jgi:hypothetical protein
MSLVLALLAATPLVIDETNTLNASQRAELDVASDGRVLVVLVDAGSFKKLHVRADALARAYPDIAVLAFDPFLEEGALRPKLAWSILAGPPLLAERARMADVRQPRQARLLHAVRFLSDAETSATQRPVPPPAKPSHLWDDFVETVRYLGTLLVGLVIIAARFLGLKVRLFWGVGKDNRSSRFPFD